MAASSKQTVDTRVTVETPEGVDFRYAIAGPGKRGKAFVSDALIRLAVLAICGWILGLLGVFSQQFGGQILGLILVVWFALSWLYGALFETFMRGQTPGKRMLNLRVLRTNGTPVTWFEAFGRNLLLVADGWVLFGPLGLYTVGIISMASTRRLQRLGDIFFDTMVVDESRSFIGRAAGLTDGISKIPREECTGRYHVPERTLAIVERLFEGDRIIPPLRREEIARPLSLAIRSRLGWNEPGPNLRNPHEFFEQAPMKHSLFLRRVLKSFGEDTSATTGDSRRGSVQSAGVSEPIAAEFIPAAVVASRARATVPPVDSNPTSAVPFTTDPASDEERT